MILSSVGDELIKQSEDKEPQFQEWYEEERKWVVI
jgi:hypothetical protein